MRWFHSGGIFASLSETTGPLIIEGMQAAKATGTVTSFDLNYRAKLWGICGDESKAKKLNREIVENVTDQFPNIKIVATTLREVHSTSHHSWSAVGRHRDSRPVPSRFRLRLVDTRAVGTATMGPGHDVHDTTEVRNWMEREIASLSPRPDLNEPTIATLKPDSGLVRVNLRPYLEEGGDAAALLKSFIETAYEYEPSVAQLKPYWSVVVYLAQSDEIPIDADSAMALIHTMAESGFPAIHHSRRYSEAYQLLGTIRARM